MLTFPIALLLVLIALLGGICITTLGPGGIFVTIALFLLLDLPPSVVAGTASATFIATGLIGSWAYRRSGELRGPRALRAALLLSATGLIGALAGAFLNPFLDASFFALLLGLFVTGIGGWIVWGQIRARRVGADAPTTGDRRAMAEEGAAGDRRAMAEEGAAGDRRAMAEEGVAEGPATTATGEGAACPDPLGAPRMVAIGFGVGLPGGLLGVGGPVLAVPLLVVGGVPMLLAVALSQVQSILIALFATAGYALQGAVDLWLALLVGVPLSAGTLAGWWIARRVSAGRLRALLGFVLFALGLWLLWGPAAAA